ncbi:hypothetical protein X975_06901, partial [Stegodyphus mimosarum]
MLTDQDVLNLAPSPSHHGFPREITDGDNNVFEEVAGVSTPPVSPRSGPTPGIILTVEGDGDRSPEVINVVGRHGSRSKTRSSRRAMQSPAHHRSPSNSRIAKQNGHKLRDPAYLAGSGVSRSQSMRTARRPQSVDPTHRFRQRIASIPNDMTLPSDSFNGQRLASNQSLPLPGDESDYMRLRNFAVTSKGLVNRGDSFRSKSRSSHSVASIGGSGQLPLAPGQPKDDSSINYPTAVTPSGRRESANEADAIQAEAAVAGASGSTEDPRVNRHRVLVIGPPDVGKTALTNQFMTSEYIC